LGTGSLLMPRNARCILPGLPYHVTQRGTNRQRVFFSTAHRKTYLGLMARHLEDADVRVLAYCLMSNHVHWVVVPGRADSLAVLFRRVHGAYAQAVNAGLGRSGHLWQNRFYSCPLSERHLWIALRYVESNAVRAGLLRRVEEYRWSSAQAHLEGVRDGAKVLDWEFWERSGGSETWRAMHAAGETEEQRHLLRRCTYAGRPFGDEEFVARLEEHFQRHWRRWSFEKAAGAAGVY
jgi:putative transposase